MRSFRNTLFRFIPMAAAIVLGCGLIYLVVQQNYRQSANDPQIQIATDIKNKLENGAVPSELVPSEKVDLSKSLNTFILIFDKDNGLLASNATLNGQPPLPPTGVLDSAKQNGSNLVTWEPASGVRIALVAIGYSGTSQGVIAVGRSLTEVELREDKLMLQVVLGGIAILIVVFILKLLMEFLGRKNY